WGKIPRRGGTVGPADRVTLDESVSMAFLVVLESMTPAGRVAFIRHDVFGYPVAEVAGVTGRTPAACRQLASSARRRIRAVRRAAGPDPPRIRGARPDRGRAQQPPDRPGTVHQPQDRQRPRLPHPRQAGRRQPGGGGRDRPPPGPGLRPGSNARSPLRAGRRRPVVRWATALAKATRNRSRTYLRLSASPLSGRVVTRCDWLTRLTLGFLLNCW